MKLGAVFPQTEIGPDPRDVARYAVEIERMGYDHLVAYDHVLGADPDRPDGRPWKGSYTHRDLFHEPFVLFAYLAALTTRLELTPSVIVLPQRQTALVAKQAAEVDVLTRGRTRLGVGIGWNAVEYEALGMDFSTRGRRIAEQIELMRRLWCEPVVDFHGRWHQVTKAGFDPLPVQRPIPVWMGGGYAAAAKETNEPALRRIARIADGWLTHVQPEDERAIAHFRDLVRAAGRDETKVGLEGRVNAARVPPERWPAEVDWWRRMGATHVELNT
ncbi:MAG TPA: LLM class F420-dependent oxidoreductase, partial [Gaiellaceae bacterium]|nr:LLM class F420-dependent oxidoreductase [Gaiellaceae bacterium]